MRLSHPLVVAVGALLAASACLAQSAAVLRLELNPRAFELSLAGQRLAFSQGDPLFVILYSAAPTIWEARTWRMVGPDAEVVSPGAGGWRYEATSFEGLAVHVSASALVDQTDGEVTWDVRLENRSGGTTVGLIGPCLRNVQDRPGGFLAVPNRPGHRIDDPWKTLAASVQHLSYPVPASIKDVTKAQEVGTYEAAYPRVEDYARSGMSGVHLVGWFGQGHDSTYPDHLPSPEMGGEDGLLRLAALMKQKHLLAVYYLNARLLNPATSPSYRSHPDWAAVTESGKPRQETIGGETFDVACPGCPGYREHITGEVLRVARRYGGDGVQLDQIGAAWSVLCYDRAHGHSTPAKAWAGGQMAMLEAIYRSVRAVNPHFVCWIEGAWDGAGQHVDISQGGFWPDHPGSKPFPQMYRYTLPEHPLFGDATLGGVPYWCATDHARARRINDRAAAFFLDGDCRDDVGLTLAGPGEAHWFVKDGEALISVRNASGQDQTFDVVLEPGALATDGPYARALALAANADIPLGRAGPAFSLRFPVPSGQVEAVLLTPAR
jgi:hypothetical protein